MVGRIFEVSGKNRKDKIQQNWTLIEAQEDPQGWSCRCTDLLDVLFDLSGDKWVVDDSQYYGRVMAADPAAD